MFQFGDPPAQGSGAATSRLLGQTVPGDGVKVLPGHDPFDPLLSETDDVLSDALGASGHVCLSQCREMGLEMD